MSALHYATLLCFLYDSWCYTHACTPHAHCTRSRRCLSPSLILCFSPFAPSRRALHFTAPESVCKCLIYSFRRKSNYILVSKITLTIFSSYAICFIVVTLCGACTPMHGTHPHGCIAPLSLRFFIFRLARCHRIKCMNSPFYSQPLHLSSCLLIRRCFVMQTKWNICWRNIILVLFRWKGCAFTYIHRHLSLSRSLSVSISISFFYSLFRSI